jgi:hypothetical protein
MKRPLQVNRLTVVVLCVACLSLHNVFPQELCDVFCVRNLLACLVTAGGQAAVGVEVAACLGAGGRESVHVACACEPPDCKVLRSVP